MGSPKRYRAKVARVHIRMIWIAVQNAKSSNRTQDDWLDAANRELSEPALAKVGLGAMLQFEKMEKPSELVEMTLSFEALCGVKLALVQSATDAKAGFAERRELLAAADSFGDEFGKVVRKAAKLPENDDLEEDKELDGVPCIEEPKKMQLVEKKKEAPRAE